MAEWVYAEHSKCSSERIGGSSPSTPTKLWACSLKPSTEVIKAPDTDIEISG